MALPSRTWLLFRLLPASSHRIGCTSELQLGARSARVTAMAERADALSTAPTRMPSRLGSSKAAAWTRLSYGTTEYPTSRPKRRASRSANTSALNRPTSARSNACQMLYHLSSVTGRAYSARTVNGRLRRLAMFYNWAFSRGLDRASAVRIRNGTQCHQPRRHAARPLAHEGHSAGARFDGPRVSADPLTALGGRPAAGARPSRTARCAHRRLGGFHRRAADGSSGPLRN